MLALLKCNIMSVVFFYHEISKIKLKLKFSYDDIVTDKKLCSFSKT